MNDSVCVHMCAYYCMYVVLVCICMCTLVHILLHVCVGGGGGGEREGEGGVLISSLDPNVPSYHIIVSSLYQLTSLSVMVVGSELAIMGALSLTSSTSMTTDTRDTALRTSPAEFVLHACRKHYRNRSSQFMQKQHVLYLIVYACC